ncbi:MAG: alpha/beta fold hydrolase [Alphaproteobacteria bacterium]
MSALEPGAFFHVNAAGHRLRAQWIGGPVTTEQKVLVFLHEGLGSIPQWKGFPAALCRATGLPGLVYERWGYGGSEAGVLPRPKDFMEREAEEALPEVLAACGVTRSVLIGHSDGGTIALLHAAAFPERAEACVTLAAHVFIEDVTRSGLKAAVARWEAGDLRDRLARYHGAGTEAMFRGWAETWLDPELRDWNVEHRMPAITCPVLVIQGVDDAHGTPAQVAAIAKRVSGPVETWMIPDCGHRPHIEQPNPVRARITEFIEGLPD